MNHKVTMQDIADRLNITKVSVSKALNNKAGVGDTLRSRILETAEDMGYMIRKPLDINKAFGFFVSKRFFLETDKFYNVIFYYLNKLVMEKGGQLIPFAVENEESEITLFDHIDGIYIAGELSEHYIKSLRRTCKPVVAIDFYKTYLDVDYVLVDNFYLGYCAARYLIDKGHCDIGFVGNINQTSSINDRYFGYLKALQNAGLTAHQKWVIANDD